MRKLSPALGCDYYAMLPNLYIQHPLAPFLSFTISKYPPPPPPPPPPAISYGNWSEDIVRISEDKWTKDTSVEVVGPVKLTADREVKGIWMDRENRPYINLNGKLLVVGSDGINAVSRTDGLRIDNGRITSSGGNIIIKSDNPQFVRLDLDAIISDDGSRRVGVVMNGSAGHGMLGIVAFTGSSANTFTGSLVVEGRGNMLFLDKDAGVTSVRGNIYIRNGGRVAVSRNDQIADTSTVTLVGNGSIFSFAGTKLDYREKVHRLIVQSGDGILNFQHHTDGTDRGKRLLYFDDLIITDGASLRVAGWEEGRDHLLVRKDSKHLADAMKKISIDGWAKNQIYLKEYDETYWSIEAAPEPATYGAAFAVLALGVVALRSGRRPVAKRGRQLVHLRGR